MRLFTNLNEWESPVVIDTLILSSNDIQRLEPLLNRVELGHDDSLPDHLAALADRVGLCRESTSAAVPADVVTMNSRVRLRDLGSDEEVEYELVFPKDAEAGEGKISVLAPVGAALLGARVGQVIDVSTPRQARRLLVHALEFQPEAVGRYDL